MERVRLSVLPLIALLLTGHPAVSQDAGQVLATFVSYGTLKNSTKLTQEQTAAIATLEQQARAASAANQPGVALKRLYQAMATVRGVPWTPERALSAGLTLKPAHYVLEPGQTVVVSIGQLYPLDELPAHPFRATFSLVPLKELTPAQPLKTLETAGPDFSTPLAQPVTIPANIPAGNYRIALTLQASEPIVKTAAVHVELGLAAKQQVLAKREQSISSGLSRSLRPALESASYGWTLLDLADKGEVRLETIDFSGELTKADQAFTAISAGRDPYAAMHGDSRQAYQSNVDRTLQPYRVYVPTAYDATKPYPLIIALHGMGGDENSIFDQYGQGAFKKLAEERGYLVACPKGRQPTSMYQGPAEQDVLDVLARMRQTYQVDPNRIYLTGHSMGGYGTWSIAMDHPTLFAALAPIAGGGNPAGMSKIAQIPQLIIHGDADKTVPVERSREMVAAAKKLGVPVKYLEVPGGSHVGVAVPAFKDIFDWFDRVHK